MLPAASTEDKRGTEETYLGSLKPSNLCQRNVSSLLSSSFLLLTSPTCTFIWPRCFQHFSASFQTLIFKYCPWISWIFWPGQVCLFFILRSPALFYKCSSSYFTLNIKLELIMKKLQNLFFLAACPITIILTFF